MPIEFRDISHIGGMKPWACSYTKEGARYAITLYGTDPAQVLEDNCADLNELTVDGLAIATGRDTGERPDG